MIDNKVNSKGSGGVVLDADGEDGEVRRVKNCQIEMIVFAISDNGGCLYPLPVGINNFDKTFLRKVVSGLYKSKLIGKDAHRTVRVTSIVEVSYKVNDDIGAFMDWLDGLL